MAFVRNLDNLDASLILDRRGVEAMVKRLEGLPAKFRKSAERVVLRAGAKPILKEAKARVPKKSGILKKSLGVKVHMGKTGGAAYVGPRSGFKYAKGETGRRRDKGKGKKVDAQEVAFYQETGTPNQPARPFIRPAIDAASGAVLTAMAENLDKYLTKLAARLKAKG